MKVEVKRACGCTEQVNLKFLSNKEKEIEWREKTYCRACRDKKYLEDNLKGDKPVLTGTDKQIAWAYEIRENCYKLVDDLRKQRSEYSLLTFYLVTLGAILENQSAKWWISNKEVVNDKNLFDKYIINQMKYFT